MAAKQSPARSREDIVAEMRKLRQDYVGPHQHRAGLLDEALEAKRAEAVAEKILALEAELAK